MKILLSPYSQILRNGEKNPKEYPFWGELVEILKGKGYNLVQIGLSHEPLLNVHEAFLDCPEDELKEVTNECDLWISVDNFFQHLCNRFELKKGIVLWGKSDPSLFGYEHNVNLFVDRKNFRKDQFDIWEKEKHSSDVFVSPDIVVQAIDEFFKL